MPAILANAYYQENNMNREEIFKLAREYSQSIAAGSTSPLLAVRMIRELLDIATSGGITAQEIIDRCFIFWNAKSKKARFRLAITLRTLENTKSVEALKTSHKSKIKRLTPYQKFKLKSKLKLIDNTKKQQTTDRD